MKIRIESNNLVYDEMDPRCRLTVIGGKGYVEVLDLGAEHCRYETPEIKRYMGNWDWANPVGCVDGIIKWGSKWETLPR